MEIYFPQLFHSTSFLEPQENTQSRFIFDLYQNKIISQW